MVHAPQVSRRRQYCARCGQLMFEFFRSPDGCFGLASDVARDTAKPGEVRCPACGARYRLLDKLDAMGQPVVRA
jgi:ribosomal protein S27AE